MQNGTIARLSTGSACASGRSTIFTSTGPVSQGAADDQLALFDVGVYEAYREVAAASCSCRSLFVSVWLVPIVSRGLQIIATDTVAGGTEGFVLRGAVFPFG
jgi:hypothetical protein